MVIDSSAILAVYFVEPGHQAVAQIMRDSARLLMSTVNLTECLMRIRDKHPDRADELSQRLLQSGIDFIPVDIAQSILAADARNRFPLNLGRGGQALHATASPTPSPNRSASHCSPSTTTSARPTSRSSIPERRHERFPSPCLRDSTL